MFNEPNFDKIPNFSISDDARDLITKMLTKSKKSRITIFEVKQHCFFKDFDFEALTTFKIKPPIIPATVIYVYLFQD